MAKRAGSKQQARPAKKTKEDTAFSTPDDNTDVIFTVEGKPLYFNKTILGMCSPAFKELFTRDLKEIHLPENYENVVAFFKQIHPAYSAERITDATIRPILHLADKYNAASVRTKCEQYINLQVKHSKEAISSEKLLKYFVISDEHKLKIQRKNLLELLAQRKMEDLKKCPFYDQVPQAAMIDIAVKRSSHLESVNEKALQVLKELLSKPTELSNLFPALSASQCKCSDFKDYTKLCQSCGTEKIEHLVKSFK